MDIEQKIITPILPILKSYDLRYDSKPKAQQNAYDTRSLDDNFENYPAAIYEHEPVDSYFETYDGYGNKKYISGGKQMRSRLRPLNKKAVENDTEYEYIVKILVSTDLPYEKYSTSGLMLGHGLVSVHDWDRKGFPYKCSGFPGSTYSGQISRDGLGEYTLIIHTSDDEQSILNNLYKYYDKQFYNTFKKDVNLDSIELERLDVYKENNLPFFDVANLHHPLNRKAIAPEQRAYQNNDGAEYSRKFHEDRVDGKPQEDVRTTLPVAPTYRSQDSYSEYINGNHENKVRKELENNEPHKQNNRIEDYIKEFFEDDGFTFTDKQ